MQNEDKLVSIVMPTYNRARRIQHAIRSVIDQTYKNWELIIVDDGSEDGTKRVVESFAHPRVKYYPLEHTGYVSRVRNAGNKLAKGEIIIVHDSDDVAFPDRVEEIVKVFNETNADVVYHGMYLLFYDPYHDAFVRKIRPVLPYEKEHLLKEQYIPGQVAYKRKVILELPYLESIRCCDDYDMLLRLALNDKKFVPLYKNLYEYADSPDSINVGGEKDGSRKRDVEIILGWLKKDFNLDIRSSMTKTTVHL